MLNPTHMWEIMDRESVDAYFSTGIDNRFQVIAPGRYVPTITSANMFEILSTAIYGYFSVMLGYCLQISRINSFIA